ncbi:hypothetical protein J6590_009979 [Homalodisca vitripennis]|nr:hypothetical protein J6590_009979 [Homalodisca vitripennis]
MLLSMRHGALELTSGGLARLCCADRKCCPADIRNHSLLSRVDKVNLCTLSVRSGALELTSGGLARLCCADRKCCPADIRNHSLLSRVDKVKLCTLSVRRGALELTSGGLARLCCADRKCYPADIRNHSLISFSSESEWGEHAVAVGHTAMTASKVGLVSDAAGRGEGQVGSAPVLAYATTRGFRNTASILRSRPASASSPAPGKPPGESEFQV